MNVSGTGWVTLDITSLVQDWVNGDIKEYGVLLKAATESGDNYAFIKGSESTDTQRPYLEISYF